MAVNVTYILSHRDKDPVLSSFTDALQEPLVKIVGGKHSRPSFYDKGIGPSVFGVFINYICRHYMDSKAGNEIKDDRAVMMCKLEGKEWLTSAYESFTTCRDTAFILPDIFNTSLAHTMAFRGTVDEYIVSDEEYRNLIPFSLYQDIVGYLDTLGVKDVVTNPVLGRGKVAADANLLVGRTLVSFKTSSVVSDKSKKDFAQLLMYASLFNIANPLTPVNTLVIYNPLEGKEWRVDISMYKTSRVEEWMQEIAYSIRK